MGNRINNFKTLMKNPLQRNIYGGLVVIGVTSLAYGYWVSQRPTASNVAAGVNVASVPKLNAIPGSSDSQRYNEMVQQQNDLKVENALNTGSTFVPTIVNNQINALSPLEMLAIENQKKKEKLEMEENEEAKKKEMEKLAAESFNPPPLPPEVVPQPPVQVAPIETVYTGQPQAVYVDPEANKKWKSDDYILVAALQDSWKNKESTHEFNHFGKENQNRVQAQTNVAGITQTNTQMQSYAQVAPVEVASQKAGDIIHAVLDTGVNSAEPSPIMATIVSGQYKGAKLLGRFMRSGKKVVLQFNTMSIPGYPKSVTINTIAIDPDTNRTSMATDVDNHYFLKYGVLLAATFVKGYADAISNQGTTTTVTPLGGIVQTQDKLNSKEINQRAIGEVGSELANQTKESINGLEPTIYVDAGTPMGILFMEDFYLNGSK